MNTNDSKSPNNSKQPSQNSEEKQPGEFSPLTPPPPASPYEPTSIYPKEPFPPYSNDSSQYPHPNKPASEEPGKNYTTEPLDTARIARDDTKSSEETQKERGGFENKNRQTFDKSTKEFYRYSISNKEQTITYILLILGFLFLLFFNHLLGSLILGMVAGYYFFREIIYYIRHLDQIMGGQDHLRYLVLTALFLGIFIVAPGIFIGAVVVAIFKRAIAGPRDSSFS